MTYTSAGENWESSPGCKCRPTNVLYWELSEADTTGCPVHGEPSEDDQSRDQDTKDQP